MFIFKCIQLDFEIPLFRIQNRNKRKDNMNLNSSVQSILHTAAGCKTFHTRYDGTPKPPMGIRLRYSVGASPGSLSLRLSYANTANNTFLHLMKETSAPFSLEVLIEIHTKKYTPTNFALDNLFCCQTPNLLT